MKTTGRHSRFRGFLKASLLTLVLTVIFLCVPMVQSKAPKVMNRAVAGDSGAMEPNTDTSVTVQPDSTKSPYDTEEPSETPASSVEPSESSTPEPSVTPTKSPFRLKTVSGVTLTRYSTHAINVSWKKNKKAKFYRVYYSKKKDGSRRLAGITKDTRYRVKKLANHTTYYFYVVACKKKKVSDSDSNPSKAVHIKTKTYVRKIIFAGDSITKGIMDYGMLKQFHIKGTKKVVAAIGLNTVTFHTRRAFNGMTGLQKLIAEKPSRVYMMLGINEVHYRKISDMLADYKSMIQVIKKSSPDTDIVLCAISPVTRAEQARNKGFWQLPVFNKKLKALAKKTKTKYFDYAGFLRDSDGYLKAQYAAGDGYHWIPSAYTVFASVVSKYDKSLD